MKLYFCYEDYFKTKKIYSKKEPIISIEYDTIDNDKNNSLELFLNNLETFSGRKISFSNQGKNVFKLVIYNKEIFYVPSSLEEDIISPTFNIKIFADIKDAINYINIAYLKIKASLNKKKIEIERNLDFFQQMMCRLNKKE